MLSGFGRIPWEEGDLPPRLQQAIIQNLDAPDEADDTIDGEGESFLTSIYYFRTHPKLKQLLSDLRPGSYLIFDGTGPVDMILSEDKIVLVGGE